MGLVVSGSIPLPILGVVPSIIVVAFAVMYVWGVISGYVCQLVMWGISAGLPGAGNRTARHVSAWILSLAYLVLTVLFVFVGAIPTVATFSVIATVTGTGVAFGLISLSFLFTLPHLLIVTLLYVVADCASLPPVPASAGLTTRGEAFHRGMLIGLNAIVNVVLGTGVAGILLQAFAGILGMGIALVIGLLLGILTVLGASMPAGGGILRFFVGWGSWLLPMSWGAIFLGWVLFVLNHLGNVVFLTRGAFGIDMAQIDLANGTMTTEGGIVANFRFQTMNPFGNNNSAYDLGSFSFLHASVGAGPDWFGTLGASNLFGSTTPDHEAGHNLNLASFGSWFLLIDAIDENVAAVTLAGSGGASRGQDAYAERLAESNRMQAGGWIPMWGP